MNYKGIALYLGLSYLLVALITFVGVNENLLSLQHPNLFQYLLLAAIMGIPALSAFLAGLVFPDGELPQTTLWPIPTRPALLVTLAAPVLFVVTYVIATVCGLTHPQWGLGGLLNRVMDQLSAPLPPGVESAAPAVALIAYPVISILIGATFFAFIALGSELGWRGYLSPRLQPIGQPAASIASGCAWGLWFTPLVYAWFLEAELEGFAGDMLRVVVLAIALSLVLDGVVAHTRNLGVAAMALGAFAGQDSGIWSHLFEQSSPPWTGSTGWISIAVWGIAGMALWRWRGAKSGSKGNVPQ